MAEDENFPTMQQFRILKERVDSQSSTIVKYGERLAVTERDNKEISKDMEEVKDEVKDYSELKVKVGKIETDLGSVKDSMSAIISGISELTNKLTEKIESDHEERIQSAIKIAQDEKDDKRSIKTIQWSIACSLIAGLTVFYFYMDTKFTSIDGKIAATTAQISELAKIVYVNKTKIEYSPKTPSITKED